MQFEAPDKFCPICGNLLPTNGYQYDSWGNAILDERRQVIWKPTASLICETCAVKALPPQPKRKRQRKGTVDATQEKFEVPWMEIR